MDLMLHDLTDKPADLARLSRFYRDLYIAGFPDADERESLENMVRYLRLRGEGWYGDNNYHILIASEGDRLVGASVCDYLAAPNCGVIEFVLVDEALRGRGMGQRLHEATVDILAADARRTGRADIDGIVIELNDPFQVAPGDDNYDPFERALIWDRWGYGRLCFPYVQPALSETQQPVQCLLLAVKAIAPRLRDALPSSLVLVFLESYLEWAMRIEHPDRDPDFAAMKRFLSQVQEVRVEPLRAYVGRDPEKSLHVIPVIGDATAQYAAVTDVYRRAFPPGPTAIDVDIFAQALAWPAQRTSLHYHLWGLSETPQAPIAGMASFFVMPRFAFAGYVALEPPLKGTGRAFVTLKRMEEQMIRDEAGASEWYAECVPGSAAEAIAQRVGFERVPVRYCQPDLGASNPDSSTPGAGTELTLLRKRLGCRYGATPFSPSDFLENLKTLLAEVYRMSDPEVSQTYRLAQASLLGSAPGMSSAL